MKKLNKQEVLNMAKAGVMLLGTISTAMVVGLAIKNIVPMDGLNRYTKVTITIGAGILGGIVGTQGGLYAGEMFDGLIIVPLMTGEAMMMKQSKEDPVD
jgi:hypothetical protein